MSDGATRFGKEILNLAHRGASRFAPENTLAAFKAALEAGCDGIELDVQLCKSGEVVVFHDYTLDKRGYGSGSVGEKTLAELKEMDVGSRFSSEFAGERIPTLQEVFDLVGRDIIVNIEIKSERVTTNGLEREVVETIRRNSATDSVIVSSFNPFGLWRVRKLDPSIKMGLLFSDEQALHLRKGWAANVLQPHALHPNHEMINQAFMRRARRKGFRVHAWTVNEPSDVASMIELGVNGIITDDPESVHRILAETGDR